MKVNRALLWDMDWKPEDYATERFRRWYIARVLSNGTADDIRGLEEAYFDIPKYLDRLEIPRRVRRFWEWYLEETGERPRDSHAASARPAQPA